MSTRQLLLVKRLFIEAGAYVDRSDAFSCGIAISMLQDAVELYVWALIKARGIPPPREQSGFVENLELLKRNGISFAHDPKLHDLNKARVNFKHYGNLPAPEEAKKHQDAAESFLRVAMTEHFGLSFDDLSLLDLIQNAEVKGYLLAANGHLESGDFKECASELAKARSTVLDTLGRFIPTVDRSIARADETGQGVRPFTYLVEYLAALREATLIALLKLPFDEYKAMRSGLPAVSRTMTGSWYVTFINKFEYTKDECQTIMSALVSVAVRLESAA